MKLKEAYPGLLLARANRPIEQYMGLLEGMGRSGDWTAEELKEVVTKAESKSLREHLISAGGSTSLSVATRAEVGIPRQADVLAQRYTTMGRAWVALSLQHSEFAFLNNLRIESYEAFSKFTTSEGSGMRGGTEPHIWKLLLEKEREVRVEWFENVAELGISFNEAILRSIGAVAGHSRSDIWQELINRINSNDIHAKKGGSSGKGDRNNQGTKRPANENWQWNQGGKRGEKSDKGNGKMGPKGTKGKDKNKGNIPPMFRGKLTSCVKHKKRICYDFHIGGCFADPCAYCHECCPEPGCRERCSPTHGLWCH